SPHVSTVFKELFEEIKSAKQQQWTITNYGVLILAAIYAIKLPEFQTYLKVLVWVTAVAGSALLLWVQCNIAQTRRRLDEVHNTFLRQMNLGPLAWLTRI